MNTNRALPCAPTLPSADRGRPVWTVCAVVSALLAPPLRAGEAPAVILPPVQIVGTTPLPGPGLDLARVPANVQTFGGAELRRQGAPSVADFIERNATGVTVNAAQGNPFQPDINLRGFTASPLLGTPQGLSVFFDGVRINEPFGDGVNWDLIPHAALSSIQLIPGSNPVFGLNTLGGAVALYSRSGASAYPLRPGGAITLSGGSFGRRIVEVETGGVAGAWDWFLVGDRIADRGWAQHNASRLRRAFGRLGWHDATSQLDLTFGGADNRLEGTQTLPASFDDIRAPYTFPDANRNRLSHVAVKASHQLSARWTAGANAYLRRFRNSNLSSNVDDDNAGAVNDASSIRQTSRGGGVQLTGTVPVAGRPNQLVVGASVDQGRARFVRTEQPATFTADRAAIGSGPFADDTDADTRTRYLGLYFSDSLSLGERWAASLAGRYNRADVRIADRSGTQPALNGSHRFQRFNPAFGLNYNPTTAFTAYASYNEGMRAPTAIELTCADPDAPCKLPNSFLADPPLKPVISKTIEAGARGRVGAKTRWSAAVFRTELHDDLQFVNSDAVAINSGYFRNVGKTRRQGVELDGQTGFGRFTLAARYAFIDARFRTPFSSTSPHNSSADADGVIAVQRGDRIPGIPRQSIKLRLAFDATPQWQLGLGALFAGSVPARGDENNRDIAGRVSGYGVFNLDTSWQPVKGWRVFARVDNVFDRRYANFGILGNNVFTGPGRSFDPANARAEQFRGYGAPRGVFAGVQLSFD